MLVIDQARNGDTVDVAAGEPFRIQLSAEPDHRIPLAAGVAGACRRRSRRGRRIRARARQTGRAAACGIGRSPRTAPPSSQLQFERKRAWETQAAEVVRRHDRCKGALSAFRAIG